MDDELILTPFDPERGIWFKYGSIFIDRDREIAEFEQAAGFKLPAEFVDMIGDLCEGGFDIWYRVHVAGEIEICWTHLRLMRLLRTTDYDDLAEYDTLKLLRQKESLFFREQTLAYFPFGDAFRSVGNTEHTQGYLAFDVARVNAIVFIAGAKRLEWPRLSAQSGPREDTLAPPPDNRKPPVEIAGSFREMMLGSQHVFGG